jgi:hypothetical protein
VSARVLVSLFVAGLVAACGGGNGGGGATDAGIASTDGQLVVGVQMPELGSLVGSYHVVVKRDGVLVSDKKSAFAPGAPTASTESIDVTGPVGSLVEVIAEELPANGGAPVITRSASTRLVAGPKRLLRLRLDARCVVLPGVNGSPAIGLTCAAPTTCATGSCIPIEVGEGDLEEWAADWQNAPPPDICRPAKPGPPEVILGTGQTDYAPLTDGQTLQLEQGPQGGHHVWMALRMKNLRQAGSTTTVTSTVVDGPLVLEPLAVVFAFDRDEGGYCKLYGLRYQVDVSGLSSDGQSIPAPDYRSFLGKTMTVTAEVVDSTGARASASKTIHLADKILCADGTEACN